MDSPSPHRSGLWNAWPPLRLAAFAGLLLLAQLFWQVAVHQWTGDVFVPVIAAALFAVVLPCAAVARRHGEDLSSAFHLTPDRFALAAGTAAGLLALAPTSLLAGLSAALQPPPPEYLAFLAEQLPRSPVGVAIALVAVAAAAPLAEEIIFRGLLYRLADRRWGAVRAAILTGLFFGIAHWQPWSLFGLVALGVLLGMLYHWTGSLLAPVAAHAAHNAVSLLLLIASRDDLAARGAADESVETVLAPSQGPLDGPGGWLLAAASALLLWRLLRYLHRRSAGGDV